MFTDSQLNQTALYLLRTCFRWFVRGSSDKSHLEVERKFRLTTQEAELLPEILQSQGFVYAGLARMTDHFLPAAVDGEMLRLRREQIDDEAIKTILTFKQWVPTATGKERRETERLVQPAVGALWFLLGRLANRRALLSFSKRRHLYERDLEGHHCVVSIDEVFGLGEFSGWYLEVELLVPLSENPTAFRDRIYVLAEQLLGQTRPEEKRSYRDMLVASLS